MKKNILILITAILCLSHLVGCSSSSDKPTGDSFDTSVVTREKIDAVVLSYEGLPLDSVRISMGDTVIFTNQNGEFSMPASKASGDRFVMRLHKDGFFDRIFSKQVADSSYSEIRMVRKVNSDHCVLTSFNSAEGISVTVQKAEVVIPSNSLVVDKTGADYNGNVDISVIYYNPDDPQFRNMYPGGDLLAVNAKGENGGLVSYGMLDVEMRDPAGNLLQLKKGKTSQLSFPISNNNKKCTPDSIPLWYFSDSTGLWHEDGVSYLKGDRYVGSVSHFTAWNCDCFYGQPAFCKVYIKVVDPNGNPCPSIEVSANGGENTVTAGGRTDGFGRGELNYWPYNDIYISSPDGAFDSKIVRGLKKGEVNEITVQINSCRLKVNFVDQNNNPLPYLKVYSKEKKNWYYSNGAGSLNIYLKDLKKMTFDVLGQKIVKKSKDVVDGQLTVKLNVSKVKVKVVDLNNQPVSGMKVICKDNDEWYYTNGNGSFVTYFADKMTFDVLGENIVKKSKDVVNNQLTLKTHYSKVKVKVVDQNNQAVPNMGVFCKDIDEWHYTDGNGSFETYFGRKMTFDVMDQNIVKKAKDVVNNQLTLKINYSKVKVKVVDQNNKPIKNLGVFLNDNRCVYTDDNGSFETYFGDKMTFEIEGEKIVKNLKDVVDNQLTIKTGFSQIKVNVVDQNNKAVPNLGIFNKETSKWYSTNKEGVFDVSFKGKATFELSGQKVVKSSKEVVDGQLTLKCVSLNVKVVDQNGKVVQRREG